MQLIRYFSLLVVLASMWEIKNPNGGNGPYDGTGRPRSLPFRWWSTDGATPVEDRAARRIVTQALRGSPNEAAISWAGRGLENR